MIGLTRISRPLHRDDAVLYDALVARGDADVARRWVHHLYLPDRPAALRASHVLHALGWTIVMCDAMPSPCPGWRLRVSRSTVIEPVKLNRARPQMVRAARMVGGTYDGWDDHPAYGDDRVLTA